MNTLLRVLPDDGYGPTVELRSVAGKPGGELEKRPRFALVRYRLEQGMPIGLREKIQRRQAVSQVFCLI